MARSIPIAGDLRLGGPVDHDWPAWRIDTSWDLAFIVSFRNIDDCREYVHHPVHQANAKRLTELSEKVVANYTGCWMTLGENPRHARNDLRAEQRARYRARTLPGSPR
jgi:hypothetical protein